MGGFSFLLSLVVVLNSADSGRPGPAATPSVNKTLLLELVNNVRKKGCQCGDTWYPAASAINWNNQLETAALAHSNDMLQNNYFSHSSKDGRKAGARIEAAGYRWKAYGENIAVGYNSEKEVIAGWLKSPGHCKNILSKNFKEMGVAKAGNYWTQTFGAN